MMFMKKLSRNRVCNARFRVTVQTLPYVLLFLAVSAPFAIGNDNTQNNIDVDQRKLDEKGRPYVVWDSKLIKETAMKWKDAYPDLVRVETSQEAFQLPTAGGHEDCPFDEGVGCLNYFVTIQDFITHPENSESSNRLPEVLWSGSLHGNERVGPTAVMEAADLLLLAASCEAKPQLDKTTDSENDTTTKKDLIEEAKNCRKELQQAGIDDVHRKWLARLVSTRRLVVVPSANALGYFRDRREEEHTDPNRDFPYDLNDPKLCMQTIAARTLNEIFRQHMFQLSLTFHAGREVIGYEWGAPTYLESLSPDHVAQEQLADAYSKFGGKFPTSPQYNTGTMNELVYPVRGGMEDWAYAASWDPDRVIQCQPTSYHGYDASKSVYSKGTLRVFNMLIEASDNKTPPSNALGYSHQVLSPDVTSDENGHIARNMRLALSALDLVEPYVAVLGINDLSISDDIVPMKPHKEKLATCQSSKMMTIPHQSSTNQQLTVQWTVGGALTIQKTQLWYAKWDDVIKNSGGDDIRTQINCLLQPTPEVIQAYFESNSSSPSIFREGKVVGPYNGTGYLNPDYGPSPVPDDTTTTRVLGPVFQGLIDFSQDAKDWNLQQNDKILVVASAIVDQDWKYPPKVQSNSYAPHTGPQSHVANVRTNKDWYFESQDNTDGATKIIQGQLQWFSVPITVVFGMYNSSVGKQGHLQPENGGSDLVIDTLDLSNRSGDTDCGFEAGVTSNSKAPYANSNTNSNANSNDNTSANANTNAIANTDANESANTKFNTTETTAITTAATTTMNNMITTIFSGGLTIVVVVAIILCTIICLCNRLRRSRGKYQNAGGSTVGTEGYRDYEDDDDESDDDDDNSYDDEELGEYGLGGKSDKASRGRSARKTVNSSGGKKKKIRNGGSLNAEIELT